jgi:hypothetical protein
MTERLGANPKEIHCEECGAIVIVASASMTFGADQRCKRGHAKNVGQCPSMLESIRASKRPK